MEQRSIVEQSERDLGGAASILVRQRRDHADLQTIMLGYGDAKNGDERARAVDHLTDRALRHAFAEETVLFPAVRRLVPHRADELTGHIEGEHQEINQLLQRLRAMRPDDPGYDESARRAIALVRDDARNEEDRLLPALQAAAGTPVLLAIGIAWEVMRRAAPNLPHPRIPRRPWGNVAAGVPLAVTDRVERLGRVAAGAAGVAATLVAGASGRFGRRRT
ncbi:MAG TPA: hemerythrin domain-containing protein [Pseudonocardia sp.]|nr:hemerythrin domain-containing protein [Pseudonocardia sp.]